MKHAITAAILDLDGTILDSAAMWDDVPEYLLAQEGIALPPEVLTAFQQEMLSCGMEEYAPVMKERFGMRRSVDQINEALQDYLVRYYFHESALKPGALSFLQALRRSGIPAAVATATLRHLAEGALKRAGALALIDAIVTTEEAGRGKQYPDVYRQALAALGADKAGAWVFEDAPEPAHTAHGDGFRLCVVADDTALFQRKEMIAISDCFLPSFEQWRETLPFAGALVRA